MSPWPIAQPGSALGAAALTSPCGPWCGRVGLVAGGHGGARSMGTGEDAVGGDGGKAPRVLGGRRDTSGLGQGNSHLLGQSS